MASSNDNRKVPAWAPWGGGGVLWRTGAFLAGMVGICALLALLNGRFDGKDDASNRDFDPFAQEDFDADSLERFFRDNYPEIPSDFDDPVDWFDPIEGVPELPDPDDNYIPPVDSTRYAPNPEDSLSQIVADELIVFFNSQDLKSDMASFAKQFKALYPGPGYQIVYYNPTAGTMLLSVPEEELYDVMDALPQQITDIDFCVATNAVLEESASAPTGDPDFSKKAFDEYFRLIQTYEAWEVTKGTPEVKVAIVDSYFDLTHPEIGERYVNQIHIPSKTANVMPPAGAPQDLGDLGFYCHGSHVAGIAIGAADNGLGCSGIAPNCTWIPISLGNQLTSFNIIEGLLYAVYQGADVVNFSIGRAYPEIAKMVPLEDQCTVAVTCDKNGEALWQYVVNVANDHNCVLVTSAGNDAVLMGMDPKNRSKGLIKVEAVNGKGQAADFTNWGAVPEAGLNYSTVSAPGVDIWSSTDPRTLGIWEQMEGYVVDYKQGFQTMSGTSMAAPVVTGAVALLKSKNKDLTNDEVIKILTMTAKQFDTQHRIGPTIQIRDALDATGAGLVNFDDLMKDHSMLIGKWKSTYELVITSGSTGDKVDDIWTYFIFDTETSGTVEHRTINLKRIYTAPVTAYWERDRIIINQLSPATDAGTGDQLTVDSFVCTPDKDGYLQATCYKDGVYSFEFMLEKVN